MEPLAAKPVTVKAVCSVSQPWQVESSMSFRQRKGGSSEEAPLVSGMLDGDPPRDWRIEEHEPNLGARGRGPDRRSEWKCDRYRTRHRVASVPSGLVSRVGVITPAVRGFSEQYLAHTSPFCCCQ